MDDEPEEVREEEIDEDENVEAPLHLDSDPESLPEKSPAPSPVRTGYPDHFQGTTGCGQLVNDYIRGSYRNGPIW